MKLDRRKLLAATGACIASCGAGTRIGSPSRSSALDSLLAAHAEVLPERAGAGANHYPMAAEALEALGCDDAIEEAWRSGASGYAGEAPRVEAITDGRGGSEALGNDARFGDWLDFFRFALEREPWADVVARWAPRLAPGLAGAAFHGLIRTGHAVRAIGRSETQARANELAVALAYWAACYTELPANGEPPAKGESLRAALEGCEHPWLHDDTDIGFSEVTPRLCEAPIAPPAVVSEDVPAAIQLDDVVRDATRAFLSLPVPAQHRIWILHTVTGPAAVGLLLSHVDQAGAHRLVAHARQAVVAMYVAFGAPPPSGADERPDPPLWPDLVRNAVDSRSVHSIKLTEALLRFRHTDDRACRSLARWWMEDA